MEYYPRHTQFLRQNIASDKENAIVIDQCIPSGSLLVTFNHRDNDKVLITLEDIAQIAEDFLNEKTASISKKSG